MAIAYLARLSFANSGALILKHSGLSSLVHKCVKGFSIFDLHRDEVALRA